MATSREAAEKAIADDVSAFLKKYRPNQGEPLSLDDFAFDNITKEEVDFVKASGLEELLLFFTTVERPSRTYVSSLAPPGVPEWQFGFFDKVWLVEELEHHKPFEEYLVVIGFDRKTIDDHLARADSSSFPVGADFNPLQRLGYAYMQERFTWGAYDGTANYTMTVSDGRRVSRAPVLNSILRSIGGQENFHFAFGRFGVGTTIKHQPHRKSEVIKPLAEFFMPGRYTAPDLQPLSMGWAVTYSFDFYRILAPVIKDVHSWGGNRMVGAAGRRYLSNHREGIAMELLGALPSIPLADDALGSWMMGHVNQGRLPPGLVYNKNQKS